MRPVLSTYTARPPTPTARPPTGRLELIVAFGSIALIVGLIGGLLTVTGNHRNERTVWPVDELCYITPCLIVDPRRATVTPVTPRCIYFRAEDLWRQGCRLYS